MVQEKESPFRLLLLDVQCEKVSNMVPYISVCGLRTAL